MEKILIKGSSHTVEGQIKDLREECGELKRVTVFFDNYNFIIKNYKLLSDNVHLILQFEEKEIQVESANCGYNGGGPDATLSVLTMLGLDQKQMKEFIYYHTAVDFKISSGKIYDIDTFFLFYSTKGLGDKPLRSKIEHNRNVSVDLEKRKILIYNPQRTCWGGFINLINYMDNIRMEYYIGENSTLEGGLYLGKEFKRDIQRGVDKPDIKGVEHVNLCLYSDNFNVSCLIDRECEVQVIESTYLALTGRELHIKDRYKLCTDKGAAIRELFKILLNKESEVYEMIPITRAGKEKRNR